MKHLSQQTKTALGSQVLLTIVSDEPGEELLEQLWRKIDSFEARFSRFKTDSELTQFNHAAGHETPISSEFRAILLAAKEMAEITDGLFNPFILPALQKAGYKQSWLRDSTVAADFSERRVAEPSELIIKATTAAIPPDAAIDLGGCGKGYLLDLLAKELTTAGVTDFWLSLGGDIVVKGCDENGQPWQIDIADALEPDLTVAVVQAPTTGLLAIATSGITKRQGMHHGQPWHHIINPTDGQPAETDILTATICAPTGLAADVYASCIVTLGTAHYQAFANEHKLSDTLVQTVAKKMLRGDRMSLR